MFQFLKGNSENRIIILLSLVDLMMNIFVGSAEIRPWNDVVFIWSHIWRNVDQLLLSEL